MVPALRTRPLREHKPQIPRASVAVPGIFHLVDVASPPGKVMETEEKEPVSQKLTAGTKVEKEEDLSSSHACGVCGRSFPLLSSLSQHMRRHTREKPYKCPYCEHRTAQKGSLKVHVRSHKLGLLSRNLADKEVGDEGQKSEANAQDSPELISPSDKAHAVNGKVKKKIGKRKIKGKEGGEGGDAADSGPFCCAICGQVFPQVLLLKSHMKRHRGSQDHGCRICGRRFRQAWFLQSHMRIHQAKAQLRGGRGNEQPATINGAPQDPAALVGEECLYELCAACGNFFHDRKALRVHEKLHKLNHGRAQNPPPEEAQTSEWRVDKKRFLESLNLTCARSKGTPEERSLGSRIPELDPVCSYQTWQLATRGRLVEATEKCLGWQERLADAEVAYDTEKGEYVPLRQEKKRKQVDASNAAVKKKKGDAGLERTPNTLSHGKAGDKKKDRILLNGLGHAFYEALQTKQVQDGHVSSKVNKNGGRPEPEDRKSYLCEHCDFQTVDASLLSSHQHARHPGPPGRHSTALDPMSSSGPKASRYMDYLRSRSVLLSQPYWNPYVDPPALPAPAPALAEAKVKVETSGVGGYAAVDAAGLLNLSSSPVAPIAAEGPVKTEGLVRHQCPYCSHTTNYPEVLWIHQRVAHRVDGSSSMAPKWAPSINSLKSSKAVGSQWRRTGPPPFLEGKDCPALPAPRTHRTQPPGAAAHGSSKHQATRSKHLPKDPSPSDGTPSGGKTYLQAQRKTGEPKPAAEGGSKGPSAQTGSSNRSVHAKGLHKPRAPQHRGNAAPVEGSFPQEGLGFILARNHGGAPSNAAADRLHPRRQAADFPSAPKGSDLWAAMNMWRLHGGKAYVDPLLFAQGKTDSAGEVPVDFDVLSLLKNYSPHDLAALYQHWGFVDPRLGPQAVLQVNGSFASEVRSSSEASKQMSSRSSTSSGSLHKGT
ncbi:zinc finger protein 516-like [Cololabis saira]|uniref:zinc finger protein 516-like n=1 Tax=Cololabis saira TaxID=129043 RepID=UPI002AD4A4B3|nr:zinc finger protein 516-like [Cololabis saira]XP_061598380.1 zinc finger protein 516-like [Cololabis saira]XP_061598381.1 zinc finger protein 516-like [Cololabis saira]